jgi:ketosteroid isomerase-like protein/mono/diheme cytochrome c family protein
MRLLKILSMVALIILIAGLGFVYSGIYDVGADTPHAALTHWVIGQTRDRSVASHSSGVTVPKLDDDRLVAMGADHYAEMCAVCHLAPGAEESELRRGLYPKPPNLLERGGDLSPQDAFWSIKHGFKMTGMPAWGTTHDDHSIWALVAFLRKLPNLSPQSYQDLIGKSGEADEHSEHSHQESNAHHESMEMGSMKGDMGAEGASAPAAVVDQFFQALASGDAAAASALLDPAVVIYESGNVERSRKAYAAEHLGADAAFLKSAQHKVLSRTGDAVGALAWIATESHLTAQGSKPTDIVSTETIVLRKQPDGWKIVHIHWSDRKAKH